MNPYTQVLGAAHVMALDYLDGVCARQVTPTAEALRGLCRFDEALPGAASDPVDTLRLLHAAGSPATMASQGGRYFGLVVGGALPAAVGAEWLATAWDQLAFTDVTSPVAIKLEAVAAGWVLELLGLPPEATVSFVTGTTMGHLTGLAAARAELLRREGYDLPRRGLRDAPPVRIVASAEIHVSALKVLSLLGYGDHEIERVPVDRQGRMIADALPKLDARTIVLAQAGNVNSGSFDPVGAICDAAHAAGAWVHVDGAFGVWAKASPDFDDLTRGLERADSWTTDTHKWLNTPYECGLAICRHPGAVRAVMGAQAAYTSIGGAASPHDIVPEFSRRARGVEVWAALRSLGGDGVRELVERCCRHARRFAVGLQDLGLEVLNEVAINQVVAAAETPQATSALIEAVQRSGECWFGPTHWQGRAALRISVSSWRTTDEDVERSLRAIADARRGLGHYRRTARSA
ncbi:MAG: pyridoxal phosphate-dependent decarboxylase family protein [Caulobacterales bacterium]